MPAGTYQRGGEKHSHFNRARYLDFDGKGKANAAEFLEAANWIVEENDKDDKGRTIYTNTDLFAYKTTGEVLFPEAEIKRDRHWSYIYKGVDIPSRKLKYYRPGVPAAVYMSNESNSSMLEIKFELLHAANRDCGEEWLGDFGSKSSANFEMPEHECHKIMKPCRDKYNGNTEEHFVRIPYKYVKHFVKNDGVWVLHKDAQPLS